MLTIRKNINELLTQDPVRSDPPDILVMECARFRNGKFRHPARAHLVPGKYNGGDMVEDWPILDIDYIHARRIRDYYSRKLMVWKLMDRRLTEFHVKLTEFLQLGKVPTSYPTNELYGGLCYRLPEFYEYDIKLDMVRNKYFTETLTRDGPGTVELKSKDLCPVISLERKNRLGKTLDYWFNVQGTGIPALIRVDNRNPLAHIWDRLFNNLEYIEIVGQYSIVETFDLTHYLVSNWICQPKKEIME